MYFRRKTSAGRAYLQIVASRRVGAQVRQQVIATLGRYDDLRESGQLERLLRSGARFSTKAMVVDAVAEGSATVSEVRRLKTLEDENRRLKKLLAEAMLDNAMLKDVASKKW